MGKPIQSMHINFDSGLSLRDKIERAIFCAEHAGPCSERSVNDGVPVVFYHLNIRIVVTSRSDPKLIEAAIIDAAASANTSRTVGPYPFPPLLGEESSTDC